MHTSRKFVWILGLLFFLAACGLGHAAPKAVDGYLDLSDWDFVNGGIVNLDGEWDIYWNQIIHPAEFLKDDALRPSGTIQVPGVWNDQFNTNRMFSGHGYATYRLRIRHNTEQSLAISLRFASTAYRMWVNGDMVASNGVVGRDIHQMQPQYLPIVVPIRTDAEPIDLVIQVSNFRHRAGGLINPISLGLVDDIMHDQTSRLVTNVFLVSALLVLGIYHLMIHYWFGHGTSFLYFGLFSLVIVIRALVMGEHILGRLVGGLPWELEVRIEYVMGYLAVATGTMLIRSLYPKEMSLRYARPIVLFGFIGSVISLTIPVRYTSLIVPYMMAAVVGFSFYYAYVLGLAVIRKQDGAKLYLIAASVLLFSVLHDLYSFHRVVLGFNLIPMGMLIVSLLQALIIARRVGHLYVSEVALAEENKTLFHQISAQMEDVKRSRKLFVQAEERLRRQVAETLHGSVQTRLVVGWHHLGEALNIVQTQPEKGLALVQSVRDDLADLREREIREVSHLLHPGVIRTGLRAAVDSLVRRFDAPVEVTVKTDRSVELLDDPLDNRIPETIRLVAYRVLEEAIGNIAAHADATLAEVSLSLDDQRFLQMIVRDNGRGFDPDQQGDTGGLGLHSMMARVHSVGGTFTIESREGEGTTLIVKLPIGDVFDADAMVIRDAATGIFTRNYGEDVMRQQTALARRANLPLSVLHLRLDFGNGTTGLGKWEELRVIKAFANALPKVLHATDIPCRYDENQFVIILPNTSVKEGRRLLERLTKELALVSSVPKPFKLSGGVALYPDDGETLEALVIAARQAIHRRDYDMGISV